MVCRAVKILRVIVRKLTFFKIVNGLGNAHLVLHDEWVRHRYREHRAHAVNTDACYRHFDIIPGYQEMPIDRD